MNGRIGRRVGHLSLLAALVSGGAAQCTAPGVQVAEPPVPAPACADTLPGVWPDDPAVAATNGARIDAWAAQFPQPVDYRAGVWVDGTGRTIGTATSDDADVCVWAVAP